ncbi:hypothetical protein ABZW96_37430 [Nocardia sp. NPDC004168]|uniref:hypothetical protein n=1 Tax=Nocardia sp. NPDC004168 TaxID=3154452 RepID=UPI0033ABCB49
MLSFWLMASRSGSWRQTHYGMFAVKAEASNRKMMKRFRGFGEIFGCRSPKSETLARRLKNHRWAVSSRRKMAVYSLLILTVVTAAPSLLVGVAAAQTGNLTRPSGSNSLLSWMDVRDSSGVKLSDYLFVTNPGGVLESWKIFPWALDLLIFIIFITCVTTAIYVLGFTLSFQFLDIFSTALRGLADNLVSQMATPLLLVTSVSVGAFCIGWLIIRGFHAKAAMQVVTMVAIAIFGPIFLTDPLGDILSSNGLLAKGRDLGISVAAGLNGNDNPNPSRLVPALQVAMADGFGRKGTHEWNFGHQIDKRPGCGAAWSAGVKAGDEDRVRSGLRACGDSVAYAQTNDPTMGQVGAGLLLLVGAVAFLAFSIIFSYRIIADACNTIYHLFRAIFGFASLGFIPGPTQIALIRDVCYCLISAVQMCLNIIFLGAYLSFLSNLYQQSGENSVPIFFLAAIIEIVAIVQLRRMNFGISRANDWLAGRVALAAEGSSSTQNAGGVALGMGTAGANNSMSAMGFLSAASTISNSPVAALVAGRRNPLMLGSREDERDRRNKAWGARNAQLREAAHANVYDRVAAVDDILYGMRASGSPMHSLRAATFGAERAVHMAGGTTGLETALRAAGIRGPHAFRIRSALTDIVRAADGEVLASKPLRSVVAAHQYFERNHMDPEWSRYRLHALESMVSRYVDDFSLGVSLSEDQVARGREYMNNPSKEVIDTLRDETEQQRTLVDADRLRSWIFSEHARRVQAATRWVANDPSNFEAIRRLRAEVDNAATTDQWHKGVNTIGSMLLPQPDSRLRPLQEIPAEYF